MDDEALTTEADESASDVAAAPEPDEAMVEGSPEAAEGSGDEGEGNGMLGPLEIPSTARLLVGLAGAVMVLSTLFSWVELGPDSFPNVTGIGSSTIGVGLTVFLVGLLLLVRAKSVAATLGLSLGAFAINLVFIVIVGADAPLLGFGVWLGLAGCSVAVLGALQSAFEETEFPNLDIRPMAAGLGAALAVVASFWLDWTRAAYEIPPLSGVDSELLFGLPVLILGAIALVLTVEIATAPRVVLEGRRHWFVTISQAAGIAIAVIAGSNVSAMVVLGYEGFGSAPIVALVGGIMLACSVKEAPNQ